MKTRKDKKLAKKNKVYQKAKKTQKETKKKIEKTKEEECKKSKQIKSQKKANTIESARQAQAECTSDDTCLFNCQFSATKSKILTSKKEEFKSLPLYQQVRERRRLNFSVFFLSLMRLEGGMPVHYLTSGV